MPSILVDRGTGMHAEPTRRLGTGDAVVIGTGAMPSAGVFGPAGAAAVLIVALAYALRRAWRTKS